MLTAEHFLRDLVGRHVLVAPQALELGLDPAACLATEHVGHPHGVRTGGGVGLEEARRARAGRRHGEQLGAHIHQAEQDALPLLELRAESHHRMEHAPRQAPGAALDEAHVLGQLAEFAVLGPEAPAEPARRVPPAVEQRRADQARKPLAGSLAGHHDVARDLEVLVHRLARDEQVHDLRGPLEDQVDAEVAHDALDRHRLLAARPQAVGGLVTAAAPDLQRVVDDAPAGFGVVELGDRRFEPDIGLAAVGQRAAQLGDCFHGEGVRYHGADLLRHRVVLPDLLAPLHALVRPGAGNLETPLAGGDGGNGQREAAGVQGDECELQALAFTPEDVFGGDTDIGEGHHAVVDRLQPHEVAAMVDFHAGGIRFDGVRAITTISSAIVPLVHHSFEPLSTHSRPSAEGTAVVSSAAGSDPTSGSVSANADTAPLASRGKYFFFCSSVPNILSGCGTPMDWWAESSAVIEPSTDDTSSIAFM